MAKRRSADTRKMDALRRKKGGCLRRLIGFGLLCCVLGAGSAAGFYWHFVVKNPGAHLDREHILQLISQESPVFYRDGETKLGVFFAEEHRQYVPFDRIPPLFVGALVAAEDQGYWTHFGFSPLGIGRAMVSNLRAGRTVAGGSTLTQQTAKNLFKRSGRTYKEKLKELVNALRLERYYSKEDILEFYSNQFYVNGNGRGLGIAARFFFDKNLDQLGLLECAFLAGVVKSPNRYNPWVAGQKRQEQALAAAQERARYVLRRMLEDGAIENAAYQEAVEQELPFERGRFRYERSVVLDEVERALAQPSFRRILDAHGIGDLGTSGIRVITTIDRVVQEAALYALRHHTTEVGIALEAPKLDELFDEGKDLRPADPDTLRLGSFHRGRVVGVDPATSRVTVDLGGVLGTVDKRGNQRLARAFKHSRKRNLWAEPSGKDLDALMEKLSARVGQAVSVSVRERKGDKVVLDWEVWPELQGAVVVLEQGAVLALVGGTSNSDFNRATVAKRQLGSTWKPLLFDAALQLRWATTDSLDNRRALFPYQGWFYYPRPDHKGAPETVSLIWAAAKSENLASIWLLYHLVSPLNLEQLRQLAERVDLVPRSGERRSEYQARLHKAGIVPTEARLKAGLFEQVKEDVLVDLAFDGRDEEGDVLRSLPYGLGFEEERLRVEEDDELEDEDERAVRLDLLSRSFLQLEALVPHFRGAKNGVLKALDEGRPLLAEDFEGFSVGPGDRGKPRLSYGPRVLEGYLPLTQTLLDGIVDGSLVFESSEEGDQGEEGDAGEDAATTAEEGALPEAGLEATSPQDGAVGGAAGISQGLPSEVRALPPGAVRTAQGEGLDPAAAAADPLAAIAPDGASDAGAADPAAVAQGEVRGMVGALTSRRASIFDGEAVVLNGLLSPSSVVRLRGGLDEEREVLGLEPDLYALSQLLLCRDFRILMGLRYLQGLAARSGVRSEVAPVLSLPLGSSELTLMEAALLYQGMLNGETYGFYPDPLLAVPTDAPAEPVAANEGRAGTKMGNSPTALIREIQLASGETIYRAKRGSEPLLEPGISGEVGTLLRAVVRNGTGRRAERRVRPSSTDGDRTAELVEYKVSVPLFGKTGTTNAYRNSAFVGMVPGLAAEGDRLQWGRGVVVATYVGYDDNREMKRGAIRIAGASGSLPVWIRTAQAVVNVSAIGDRVDLADLAFSGESVLPVEWPDGFRLIEVDPRTGLLMSSESEGAVKVYQRDEPRSFAPYIEVAGVQR